MPNLPRAQSAHAQVLRSDIAALQDRLRSAGLDHTLPSASMRKSIDDSLSWLSWRRAFCVPVVCAMILPVLVLLLLAAAAAPHFKPPHNISPLSQPIFFHPDLPFLNRVLEYAFPLMFPVSKLGICPLHDGADFDTCLNAMRSRMDRINELQYGPLLAHYEEIVVTVPGQSQLDRGVGDGDLPPVEIVLLRPKNVADDEPLPLVVWFHGGGMVLGGHRDGYVGPLMEGLRQRGVDVVWASVHYRLAPDHPWPAAPEDCFRALEYLMADPTLEAVSSGSKSSNGIDVPDRWRAGVNLTGGVHLAGLSAGGNLAIVTALRAIKGKYPVRSLFVDEPMLRLEDIPEGQQVTSAMWTLRDSSGKKPTPSWHRNSYTRTAPVVWLDWCWRAYLRNHCDHGLVEESKFVQAGSNNGKNEVDAVTGQTILNTEDSNKELGASPHISCTQDSVEGGMGVSSWKSAFMPHDNGNSQASPILRAAVVVTARGCPVHDAGVAYLNALKQAEAAVWPQIEGDRSIVTHVDARGSHSFPFLMDPAAATDALDSWSWGFL